MKSEKYGFLSILLFFVAIPLVFKNYHVWSSFPALPSEQKAINEYKIEQPLPPLNRKIGRSVSTKAFEVIAEKNIFNPNRQEFPNDISPGISYTRPTIQPPIVIYGIAIAGKYQAAVIDARGGPRKGTSEMEIFRPGDIVVGDYKLAEILVDRIKMKGGSGAFEVLLYNPKVAKKRLPLRTKNEPAKITSTLSGPIPPLAITPVKPRPIPQPKPPPSIPQKLSSPKAPLARKSMSKEKDQPLAGPPPPLPISPVIPRVIRGR